MFKLSKKEPLKNIYCLEYRVAHTDVDEHDVWFDRDPLRINTVSNLDQLADYYRCFKIVENLINNVGRKGHGDAAGYLPFDDCVEEDEGQDHGIKEVNFEGDFVIFTMKDLHEHYVFVEADIGIPKESGIILAGLELVSLSWINENSEEFLIEVDT